MMKPRVSWLLVAVAAPALLFGALVSPAAAAPGIDPGRAAALIPIVLIDDTVLPGDGWDTTLNNFDESSSTPDTAACRNSDGKLKALSKSMEPNLAAKGKVEMTNVVGDLPVLVSSEIDVYKSDKDMQAALKEVKAVFASADYLTCFGSVFQKDIPGATAMRVDPFVETKADDPAAAFAAELTAPGLPKPLRVEAYFYVTGNTLALISLVTPQDGLSKSDVEFFVGIQALTIEACDCGPQ
jgi:hypothetical protein